MSPGKSRLLLGGGLLLTVLAAWFAPPLEDDNGLMLSERAQNTQPVNAGAGMPKISTPPASHLTLAPALDVLGIHPRTMDAETDAAGGRLFASSQWATTTKPVAVNTEVEPPPSPPLAPPLPFRFLGRYKDAGQSVVFLQYNDQSLVVRQGDTLGEQYKVEKLDGTTLSLRYLPLNQIQSLDVGSSQ
ncbi:MAG: hypothetical protein PHV02_07920 [Rhodocyclaceae bacterium]|nr:hypothetical protein [Rhodocyclaceae bacterium]